MEGSDFSGAAERPGAWGRCPESRLASATPLFIPPVYISVPFVNEGLVKPLQREGRKNFFCLGRSM